MSTRLRVALILPATAAVCTAELFRRGFVAPVMYGAKLWADALFGYRPSVTDEPDLIA